MSSIKGMLETGAMLFIGIIALKAFGGVKGLTGLFESMGDLFGTGTSTNTGGGGLDISGEDISDIIGGGGTIVEETKAPVEPYNPWMLFSPFGAIAEWQRYITQQGEQTKVTITGDGDTQYHPSPSDTSIPHEEPVWLQLSGMVSDIGRDGREGETWVGGR